MHYDDAAELTKTVQAPRGLARTTGDALVLPFARLRALRGPGAGQVVTFDGREISAGREADNDLVLQTPNVSRRHFKVVSSPEGPRLLDLGSTNGTFVHGTRVREAYLTHGTEIRAGDCHLVYEEGEQALPIEPSRDESFGALRGRSEAMRKVFGLLTRVAPTDLTVLITGETGTGKELAARAIHEASRRKNGPFVVFDASAVEESLMGSELFGHVKGAFTGATNARSGAFEEANGGTLFLDEIGELSLDLQPKFLRALEARTVKRVGGNAPVQVDVRILAATNRDLKREVERGKFREDLYYRLWGVQVRMPALRERREDIPYLTRHFLEDMGSDLREFSEDFERFLRQHDWPGNVRELRKVVERKFLLDEPTGLHVVSDRAPSMRGPAIDLDGLDDDAALTAPRPTPPVGAPDPEPFGGSTPPSTLRVGYHGQTVKDARDQWVDALMPEYLRGLMAAHAWDLNDASRTADVSRKHLERLLRDFSIERP